MPEERSNRILTLPNAFTILRVILLPVILWLITEERFNWALTLLIVAGISDGVDGFLVRPADVKAIATLIEDIFSEHVPVKEIGEHAHRKITSLFDTAKMVDESINSYFNILKRTQRF